MIKKYKSNDISSGKKIIGFLFTIFGILIFSLVWFLLGYFFNIIKIKDIGLDIFNLLKNNFSLKIWESDFYFKIIKTVFNVFVSFITCLLLGGFIVFISKFYYFKSFLAFFKIINIIPILFIAYLLCAPFKNISFNNSFYKFDDFVFPVVVTSLVNCGFFANYMKKSIEEESSFFSFIIKGFNLTFMTVTTSEMILNSLGKVSKENFGGLIQQEFNQNNTKVISLIIIFLLLIIVIDFIMLIIKKFIDLFR